MTELSHVISSTALNAAVESKCPRELLGLTCLTGTGYDCLCALVESVETETTKRGNAAVLSMTLHLGSGTPYAVMAALNLTGYAAGFQASHKAVTASYDLRQPQNAALRAYVAETG